MNQKPIILSLWFFSQLKIYLKAIKISKRPLLKINRSHIQKNYYSICFTSSQHNLKRARNIQDKLHEYLSNFSFDAA